MRPVALIAAIAAIALMGAGAATSAPKDKPLCVGAGPNCSPTLTAALAGAHDGDTIHIGPGTYTGGITIDANVSLVGSGAESTKISGGGPVVTIGSTSSAPTVSISNLTITGGVTTTNPQAPHCGPDVPTCGPGYADSTALGGGIEAFPGTHVNLAHTVVTGNSASPASHTQSVRAICPGDVPCTASFGDAAGIDDWGTMTLDHTTVSDNHASAVQSDGGGIAVEANASLTVAHSVVTGNSASAAAPTGRFCAGGGIFVDSGGTLTLDDSGVTGNGASVANSFPHPYPDQNGGTDMSNAIGGGVFLTDGSAATIRNSHLDHNTVTVTAPSGESFGADAGLSDFGEVSLLLDHDTVNGNSTTLDILTDADSGPAGPAAVEFDSPATISHTQIRGNSITVDATGDDGTLGAVGVFDGDPSTLVIDHSEIRDNTAAATSSNGEASVLGAGIFNNGPLLLDHDQVANNTGTATGGTGLGQGGGIANGVFFGPSPLTLEHTDVTGNALLGGPGATLQGGDLYTVGFPVTLDHSHVDHNTPDDCVGC
jgi:hypothetical protein